MKHNILVFPAEGENAFELYRALRYAVRFKIFGASSQGAAGHGRFVFERYNAALPLITEANFLDAFNAYLAAHAIEFIFPTHDSVVSFLKAHEPAIAAKVVGPSAHTAAICRDKRLTYETFGREVFCPVIYPCADAVSGFPVFVKPSQGQGGQGCLKAEDAASLRAALEHTPDLIIAEYLPGPEYTVDCFTDRHGHLLFVGPRSRDVVKMGMAFVSRVVPLTAEMESIAATINQRLPMRGLWFFQLKTDAAGRLKLLEVAARASCGMGLYRQLGVNLPLLTAYDALEMDVGILRNPGGLAVSRCLQSSYEPLPDFDAVYVDYDDTLCVNGKVNAVLIAFLYQCRNRGKRLVLLTKHEGDLTVELDRRRIAATLFDAVIQLGPDEQKAVHIAERNAILIDNLFVERAAIAREHGIPVYDVDAVASLFQQDVE